jgi:hypothetical protein
VSGQLELAIPVTARLGEELPPLLDGGLGLAASPVLLDETERILAG